MTVSSGPWGSSAAPGTKLYSLQGSGRRPNELGEQERGEESPPALPPLFACSVLAQFFLQSHEKPALSHSAANRQFMSHQPPQCLVEQFLVVVCCHSPAEVVTSLTASLPWAGVECYVRAKHVSIYKSGRSPDFKGEKVQLPNSQLQFYLNSTNSLLTTLQEE